MSFSFGKPTFGTPNAFGAPQQQQTQPTNLSFGGAAAANPAPSLFGTPAAPTNTGSGLFGAATGTVTPFGGASTTFGAAAPAPNLSFGGQPPSFGATPAPASTGLTFGTPQAQPPAFGAQGAASGLSFGAQTAPAPAATGFSFGATTTSTLVTTATAAPAPNFGFGNATSGAAATPANPGLFGGVPTAAATTAPKLSFGGTAPATMAGGLSFGTPATGFTLGGGAPTATATTAAMPALGLSFGTSAPTTGLSFGTSTATSTGTTSFGLGGGLGGGAGGLGGSQPPANVGLGGLPTTTPTTSASTKSEPAPRDQSLPNEIQQTVDGFKNFVKQQKVYSSDVARCSIKEFRKVESDIESANLVLSEVEKQLLVNKGIAKKLKLDTAMVLKLVEMAQRTYDTPIGLQYENTTPLLFFIQLIDTFERDMQNLKVQIESTDKYVKNMGKVLPLNSQDLSLGMRRIHETFVALAGRLQSVHSQVENQKEHYLTFRRNMLNDNTNVFEQPNRVTDALNVALSSLGATSVPPFPTGPTPFGAVSHPSVVQAAQNATATTPSTQNAFGGFGGSFGNTTSMFGNTSGFGQGFGTSFNNANSSFQLQKPPIGSKRGKQ